jgi:hypothetical protein
VERSKFSLDEWADSYHQARQWVDEALRESGERLSPQAQKTIAISVTNALADLLANLRKAQRGRGKGLPPGAVFYATRVKRALSPLVGQLRREVFGGPDPPFSSTEDAHTWLRGQEDHAPGQSEGFSSEDVEAQVVAEIVAAQHLDMPPLRLGLGGVEVPANTPQLRRLARGVRQIAAQAGWSEGAALLHVLTGSVPVSPLQVQILGVGLNNRAIQLTGAKVDWVDLRVFPWQLSRRAWAELRRELLQLVFPGRTRNRRAPLRLTEEQLQLLDLIADVGPPPRSRGQGKAVGRIGYWRSLAGAHKEVYGKAVKADALRMRYMRLPQRLRDEIEGEAWVPLRATPEPSAESGEAAKHSPPRNQAGGQQDTKEVRT